jgi:hypothetical protein
MSGPLGRIIIATKKAPAAIGPYNQAVQVENVPSLRKSMEGVNFLCSIAQKAVYNETGKSTVTAKQSKYFA